jgi:preprotein translocase subunit SecD
MLLNYYALWKNALIGVLVALAILYAAANIFGSDLAVQISSSNLIVGETTISKTKNLLDDKKISYKSIELLKNKVLVRFNNSQTQLSAQSALKKDFNHDFVIALNLAPSVPSWLSALGGNAMYLGLDLRGGVHFLLEVDMESMIETTMNKYYFQARSLLRKKRLYRKIRQKDANIIIVFKTLETKKQGMDLLKEEMPDFSQTVLKTNNELSLTLSESALKELKKNTLKQNITTLRNRVNELGVAEPIIQQQGFNRIVVQLPGVQDTARAKEILGSVANIEFRMVDNENSLGSKIYKFRDGRELLLKKEIIATGENISNASSGLDQDSSSPMVNLSLDSIGGKAMLKTTKKYLHHRMAVIFIENKVETIIRNGKPYKKKTKTQEIINAATIQGIFSNRFQISGLESARTARKLALLLRAGSLSAPIEIIEERTVGPSLGQDNIDKGVLSVIFGLILVLIFMLVRYKVFGLVANIALTINLVMIIAILSLLQATLTLPGIAGIVLTVGMAVDANVLIFERIKEELKINDVQQAIFNGYEKALLTISDASITTLIASIVLFTFGTGPIKGFAITLSIGIITSVFTAVIVSRALINLIYGKKELTEVKI